jgi:hypothetical protein
VRAVVITKEATDYARVVEDFVHDFQRQTGRELPTLDPESAEGISFCQAYDILEFPTIVALSDDGLLLNQWRGLPLPTISEVSYYG